ncbi:hypothetical protein CC1_20750 [Coprococcus catus GD/7]|uniref:Uncharacterized protein n=1 Tax=Coprococcus catus GD/7 TaxID=717962 RepID=D4J8X2_9FIRM|nr:hypothetical protein CC1_20750 [Coprococcus catus GD/7]
MAHKKQTAIPHGRKGI